MMIADCILEMHKMVTQNNGCDTPIQVCVKMSKCAERAIAWLAPDTSSTIVAHNNGGNRLCQLLSLLQWLGEWVGVTSMDFCSKRYGA